MRVRSVRYADGLSRRTWSLRRSRSSDDLTATITAQQAGKTEPETATARARTACESHAPGPSRCCARYNQAARLATASSHALANNTELGSPSSSKSSGMREGVWDGLERPSYICIWGARTAAREDGRVRTAGPMGSSTSSIGTPSRVRRVWGSEPFTRVTRVLPVGSASPQAGLRNPRIARTCRSPVSRQDGNSGRATPSGAPASGGAAQPLNASRPSGCTDWSRRQNPRCGPYQYVKSLDRQYIL